MNDRRDLPGPAGASDGREERGAELLEAVLSGTEPPPHDPEEARAARALELDLQRLRAAFPEAPSSAAGVNRVLSQTTRLPSGWRGDLVVVRTHFVDRLQRSRLLRLAAASLLLHLLALPLLAAWRFFEEEPAVPSVKFAPPPAKPFAPPVPEPREETPAPELDDLESGPPQPTWYEVENRLLRDRFLLDTVGLPEAPGEASDRASVRALLQARARELGEAEPLRLEASALAGPTERALWVELLLDRVARGLGDPQAVRAALAQLDPESSELARLAFERARGYGLLGGRLGARFATLGEVAAREAPLDARWRGALQRALDAHERSDAALADWLPVD